MSLPHVTPATVGTPPDRTFSSWLLFDYTLARTKPGEKVTSGGFFFFFH